MDGQSTGYRWIDFIQLSVSCGKKIFMFMKSRISGIESTNNNRHKYQYINWLIQHKLQVECIDLCIAIITYDTDNPERCKNVNFELLVH